jgi:hypothetical protein
MTVMTMMVSRCSLVLGVALAAALAGCTASTDGSSQPPLEATGFPVVWPGEDTAVPEPAPPPAPAESASASTELAIPPELAGLGLETAPSGTKITPHNDCILISGWECCDCFQQCKFIQLCNCDTNVCGPSQVIGRRASSSCRPPC